MQALKGTRKVGSVFCAATFSDYRILCIPCRAVCEQVGYKWIPIVQEFDWLFCLWDQILHQQQFLAHVPFYGRGSLWYCVHMDGMFMYLFVPLITFILSDGFQLDLVCVFPHWRLLILIITCSLWYQHSSHVNFEAGVSVASLNVGRSLNICVVKEFKLVCNFH
jgi:hypothetical protein